MLQNQIPLADYLEIRCLLKIILIRCKPGQNVALLGHVIVISQSEAGWVEKVVLL